MYAWALMMATPMIATRPSASAVWLRASRRAAHTAHWANTHDGDERQQHGVGRHHRHLMPFGIQRPSGTSRASRRNRIHSANMAADQCTGGDAAERGADEQLPTWGRCCSGWKSEHQRSLRGFRSSRGSADATVCTSTKLSYGAGDDVAHSSVWPSHGSSPAGSPLRNDRDCEADERQHRDEHQHVAGSGQPVPEVLRARVVELGGVGRLLGEAGDQHRQARREPWR